MCRRAGSKQLRLRTHIVPINEGPILVTHAKLKIAL